MAVEFIFLVVITLLQFCGVMYMVCCYVKLKRTLGIFLQFAVQTLTTMDCDNLLATLLAEPEDARSGAPARPQLEERENLAAKQTLQRKRARLAALACVANDGGQARAALGVSFKGRPLTTERIDAMEDAEVEELHTRYEARLGTAMSKSLGPSLLRLCASTARGFYLCLPPGSPSSWQTSNKTRSLVVLFRVPAVNYTTATACT